MGGKLTESGSGAVSGATVSGLNILVGGTAGQASASGASSLAYHSCNVGRAAAGLQAYMPLPNTWFDNFPSY